MRHGLVFNIQRYSVHDGPGIRTTVFLKGCPLRCAWCHNPEGISPHRELMVIETRCVSCLECCRACPAAAEFSGDRPLPARHAQCRLCGACVEACPTQARRMAGQDLSVDELLAALLEDRVFYEESGGGVTFSGGEPLLQAEFLCEALGECRARGLTTAVETCGLAAQPDLLRVARLADVVLYDLKLLDEEKHRRYTGASNRQILENLKALGREHQQIWIRVPLVPGVNDSATELGAIARLAASIPAVRQVNLLPFHRAGIHKSRRLGRGEEMAQTMPPRAEAMAEAMALFEKAGVISRAGG